MIIIIAAGVAALALLAGLMAFFYTRANKGESAGKSGSATVTVVSVSSDVDKTVKVPVELTGNPGAMGFLLRFSYDSEKLEYLNYENGDVLSDCEVSGENGQLSMIGIENQDITKNGTLVYLNFKIKDGVSGSTEVSVTCDENGICNYNEESIPVQTENGKITVK